jgi:hypothetical protein
MKRLTADYGYDSYGLALTDEEAESILNKKEFTKISEVYREVTDDEEPFVDATWKYHPKEGYFTIERDDGAFFYAYTYHIE